MLIFDSHLDLAWNALNWNRDLTLPVEEIRRAEVQMKDPHRGANTVCFPEMRRGKVAFCLATILARSTQIHEPLLDYQSQEIASAMGFGQLAYYRIMEERGELLNLRNWAAVEQHLRAWQDGSCKTPGYILSMEGADPILSPHDAEKWWKQGLRVVALSHYGAGVYGHGTSSPGGLTAKGFELLKAFEDLGMVLDTTHLSDKGFWQVVEAFRGPVLASHNNCRALVPGERQFSDEQVRCLIARGAVIGAAFDSWMLLPGYLPGQTNNGQVTLEKVVNQIDHICQVAGNASHAGIGSDLDGGFGKEQSPSDLDTIADLQKIPLLLKARGYLDSDVENVLCGNWLRFFKKAWNNMPN